ncbi:hypothetical protein ACLEC0_09920 [Lonsdalea quercina]
MNRHGYAMAAGWHTPAGDTPSVSAALPLPLSGCPAPALLPPGRLSSALLFHRRQVRFH